MKMQSGELMVLLISLGLGAVVTVIGFFLKRVIDKTDNYVEKSRVDEIEEKLTKDIEKLEIKFKEEISKVENSIDDNLKILVKDVKELQVNSIGKDDFHRQMSKYEDKLDKIMDYIVEGRR